MKKTISLVLLLALGLTSASLGVGDTWTQKADIPTPRFAPASVVNGKIYVMGGFVRAYSPRLSTVEEYDPARDTWTTKAPMLAARSGFSSSVVNGKIYTIGGGTNGGGAGVSTVEEYDPVTDTWIQKTNVPRRILRFSTSVVDGKIYAIGGTDGKGIVFSTVEEYDPARDTWTTKAPMPTARSGLSCSVVNGKIYAIGGQLEDERLATIFSTVEEYDPVTDTWTKKRDMPAPRANSSTSVVDDKIYCFGGSASVTMNGTHLSTVFQYDPATDTWTAKDDMPVRNGAMSTCTVDGRIYVIGGSLEPWPNEVALSTVWEYYIGLNVSSLDFNGDGIIDSADMSIMVDHWHTDNALYDIAPEPFGDGIVDVQDLVVLSEYLLTYPGAVAYWNLDEIEGDIALDSIGVYDGVLNGLPTWQPAGGAVDGALLFDSIDDYVSTPFVLNPSDGKFSVFAWIKGGAAGQVVISQTSGGVNWLLADPSEGNLMTELKGSGRSGKPLQSQTNITDGNWHRIGLVWDGSNRTLYVDGVPVAQDTQDGLESSEGGLYIGTGKAMEAGTYFSGLIDDVRIYNRAVSP
jgi:N-acetylneuraminic acid mutarotase